MILVNLVIVGINVVTDVLYLSQLERLLPGLIGGDLRDIETTEMIRGFFGIVTIGVNIATAIVFLMWIYRAHDNLRLLRVRGCQYSAGWAVGYFFIPILNLARPLQVTQEIWKASDPQVAMGSRSWQGNSNSAAAGVWWTFWLISGITAYLQFNLAMQSQTNLEMLKPSVVVAMISGVADIFAGIFVILVINGIMRRQKEKLHNQQNEEADYLD
jgi:hypothetical protein